MSRHRHWLAENLFWWVVFAGWTLLSAAGLQGAETAAWPTWRGPLHDGQAPVATLVDEIPPAGLPIVWVRELGAGFSGFAVVGDRAYTQVQTLYDQSLVCLDMASGATVWSHRYGWQYEAGGLYPGPRATPTVAAGKVFYLSPQGVVGCVTVDKGKPVWSVDVHTRFRGRGAGFGYSSSPLVIDGMVILPVGGEGASVIALAAETGQLVWQSGSQPASYATPLPISWQGEPLVVVPLQNTLACFHRRTGECWWELPVSHGYDEHSSAPLYREPYLLVANPFRAGAQQYRLEPVADTGKCKPVLHWDSPKLSNDVASSVLVDETIYGFDLREPQARLHRPSRGEFRALDWLSGKVHWSSSAPGHAQIIAANGKLVLWNDRGEVVLIQADPQQYRELGRMPVFSDEICWTPPALANNYLVVRSPTRAACIYMGREPLLPETRFTLAKDLPRPVRFHPHALLGGEREFPATLPEWSEYWLWYRYCAALLLFAWAAALLLRAIPSVRADARIGEYALLLIAIVLGAVGSRLLHQWQSDYVFTWPLSLWGMFQLALLTSWATRHSRLWSWQRGSSYLMGSLFLASCGLYFHLCHWQGLALEWGFLFGFIPALPLGLGSAWLAKANFRGAALARLAAHLAAFSAYFWSSVGLLHGWLS